MIATSSEGVLCGDVVSRTDTGSVGVVLETRPNGDGAVECLIYVSTRGSEEWVEYDTSRNPVWWARALWDRAWWDSRHIRQVPRRDPYRRYLAMRAAEDDDRLRERRLGHLDRRMRQRRFGYGPYLSEAAWQKAYWRLRNLRKIDPCGMFVGLDLGREHWIDAANDCLDRRDRAKNYVLGA